MPIVDKSQRIDTDQWVFHKPTKCMGQLKNGKGRSYSTQWHRKIGFLQGSSYKEIAASKLPPIGSAANKGPEGRKNPIYTRFSRRQHKRNDEIQTLLQVLTCIETPKGLYDELCRSVPRYRHEELGRVLNKFPRDTRQLPVDMTTEMYEKLTEVLDEKSDHLPFQDSRGRGGTTEEQPLKLRRRTLQNVEETLLAVHNPYKYMAKKEKQQNKGLNKKETTKQTVEDEHPWGTPEEIHLKAVVQDFCDWLFDIGGDHDNMDEATLSCLFSGGYDTRPNLSMPVQVVKKNEIPPELTEDMPLMDAQSSKPSSLMTKSIPRSDQGSKDKYKPFRYGAWYLDPKTWRKMDLNEPLEDPNLLKEGELSDADIRKQQLNEELAAFFIPEAFLEFLKKKRARIPSFLLEVAQIQKEMKEREQQNEEEQKGNSEKVQT